MLKPTKIFDTMIAQASASPHTSQGLGTRYGGKLRNIYFKKTPAVRQKTGTAMYGTAVKLRRRINMNEVNLLSR